MATRPPPNSDDRSCVSADEAFRFLRIDRTTGYRAIKAGSFPLPVIRVGRTIRIPTAALRSLLELDAQPEGVASSAQPRPTSRSA
jgi:predicted DNA-binding transcriptional regulator AlpA